MKLPISKDEFIRLYNELTYIELAKKLNVSIDTIRRYKDKLGLSKKVGRKPCELEFTEE